MNLQWLKPDMEVRIAVQINLSQNPWSLAFLEYCFFLQKFIFIHI